MGQELQKVNYSHEALADAIIANPSQTHKQLAEKFSRSTQWVSYVLHSDAFQAFLAQRKKDVLDPVVVFSVEERLRGLASKSMDILMDKLDNPLVDGNFLLKTMELSTKALGYGARPADAGVNVQNNFVVAMPQKAASAAEWASGYKGGALEAGK